MRCGVGRRGGSQATLERSYSAANVALIEQTDTDGDGEFDDGDARTSRASAVPRRSGHRLGSYA